MNKTGMNSLLLKHGCRTHGHKRSVSIFFQRSATEPVDASFGDNAHKTRQHDWFARLVPKKVDFFMRWKQPKVVSFGS